MSCEHVVIVIVYSNEINWKIGFSYWLFQCQRLIKFMMESVWEYKELPWAHNGPVTGDEPLGLFEHQHGLWIPCRLVCVWSLRKVSYDYLLALYWSRWQESNLYWSVRSAQYYPLYYSEGMRLKIERKTWLAGTKCSSMMCPARPYAVVPMSW